MRRLAGVLIVCALLAPVAASATSHPRSPVFRDDFNGTTLDLTKWQPNWLGANNSTITPPVNGAELSCYDPSQVSVAGGYLHLRAAARSMPKILIGWRSRSATTIMPARPCWRAN